MNGVSIYVLEVDSPPIRREGVFTLIRDNWDDYHFKTSFVLHYADKYQVVNIGMVKIGKRGMNTLERRSPSDSSKTKLPEQFCSLEEPFFSLGQDAEYYERLLSLPGNK